MNKPITVCAWHPKNNEGTSHIKLPDFLGGKYVDVTQKSFERIERRRQLTHGICPPCENIFMMAEERDKLKPSSDKQLPVGVQNIMVTLLSEIIREDMSVFEMAEKKIVAEGMLLEFEKMQGFYIPPEIMNLFDMASETYDKKLREQNKR